MELRIKKICKEQGITMGDLADAAKIHRVSLSLIDSGKMNPTLKTLQDIAEKLGVNIADLLQEPKELKCPKCGEKIYIITEEQKQEYERLKKSLQEQKEPTENQ